VEARKQAVLQWGVRNCLSKRPKAETNHADLIQSGAMIFIELINTALSVTTQEANENCFFFGIYLAMSKGLGTMNKNPLLISNVTQL
jgi:hypothetical protein